MPATTENTSFENMKNLMHEKKKKSQELQTLLRYLQALVRNKLKRFDNAWNYIVCMASFVIAMLAM
jgi:hypothetical protein